MYFLTLDSSTIFGEIDPELIMWIALTVIFLVIEATTVSLTTIWFAFGSVIAAILSALNVGIKWQIIIFVAASVLLLIFTRPIAKKLIGKKTVTNKDTLIGMPSYVTEKIDNINQTGYVKINDVYWAARSKDGSIIDKGVLVEIKEIQGNKLIVSTVKGDQ